MTKREIVFNYNQTISQANKLDQIAEKLDRLSSDKIESTIGMLKGAWQSDNSSTYYFKAEKVKGDIITTAKEVRQIANSVRSTAEAVKRAELRALEIAKARTYQ